MKLLVVKPLYNKNKLIFSVGKFPVTATLENYTEIKECRSALYDKRFSFAF